MAKLQSLILSNNYKLNDSEKKILQFVVSNAEECSELSLTELAKHLYASESAIFRMCKKIGLSGYSELKFELHEIANTQKTKNIINKDFESELIKANKALIRSINSRNLNSLFCDLENAGMIYIYSTGWQQEIIAKYLEHELFMIGCYVRILPSAKDELELVEQFAKKNDIFIIISFSGDNEIINEKVAKMEFSNTKFKYVSITNLQQSKLAYLAQHNLYFPTVPYATNKSSKINTVGFSPVYTLIDVLVNEFIVWRERTIKDRNVDND